MKKEILLFDSIRPVIWHNDKLRLLDQRKLPDEEVYLDISSTQALSEAIKQMCVRGAPAIGIAAAFGAVLAAQELIGVADKDFKRQFNLKLDSLAASRPTAINLFNAVNSARRLPLNIKDRVPTLLAWAKSWLADDIQANKTMAQLGAECLTENTRILTHCNAGALATGGYGTALGVVRQAYQKGLTDTIYAGETRPWNQGARLTLWELQKESIPATLLADSAAASLMKAGKIDWIIVGADCITRNGDVANKIGTYSLAVLAKYHQVKLMVVAPTTTFDLKTQTGDAVLIENRSKNEILPNYYSSIATLANAWNPVFDITPAELITVIVTEKGLVKSPDARKIEQFIQDLK